MENNISAENAVIGSMLIAPSCIGAVVNTLTPDDFLHETARSIFSVIRAQYLSGQTLDPVTVAEKLSETEGQYMAECMRVTPTANNIEAYTELVRRSGLLHRMQVIGLQLANSRELEDAEKLIAGIGLVSTAAQDGSFQTAQKAAEAFMDSLNERREKGVRFIRWGIEPLDRELHTRRGNFVVIGARPSTGKSALALQCALRMAMQGYRVGFVSLEMGSTEMNERAVAYMSQVSLNEFVKGEEIADSVFRKTMEACSVLYELPIGFDYSSRTVPQIQARALSERWDVVFVDYLQLMTAGGSGTRYERVTEISQGLQQLAHRNNILVVALSQLSRPLRASGAEHRPTLTDLRDSGQIEQDADAVILMSPAISGNMKSDRFIQLAKNRQGQCCDFYMSFDGATQTFTHRGSH